MRKRLLITGASGFIGRHCLAAAAARGFETWAVARRAPTDGQLQHRSIHWRVADILQSGAIERLLDEARPTHVLHLAWETTHGAFWESAANRDWLAFGARFIRAFASYGGERFVSAGSCAEYDWRAGETVAENPATLYGKTKLAHHRMLMDLAREMGLSAATGRVFLLYGPFENVNRLVPYACERLLRGEKAFFGDPHLQRDFLHVRDVGEGLVALLAQTGEGAFDICSGRAIALGDVIGALARIAGRPDLIHWRQGPVAAPEPGRICGDPSRLRALGWRPGADIERGLAECYAWRRRRLAQP